MKRRVVEIQDTEGLVWTVNTHPWNREDKPDVSLNIEAIEQREDGAWRILCRPIQNIGQPLAQIDGRNVGFELMLADELIARAWSVVDIDAELEAVRNGNDSPAQGE